ncbi:unnamed protein product [Schistosoma spindalis]|nr:unnamed protein product [Schistosoma spindale]
MTEVQSSAGAEQKYGGAEGADAMYVKLVSSDDHEFYVRREHALTSGTIKAMLSGPVKNCCHHKILVNFHKHYSSSYKLWLVRLHNLINDGRPYIIVNNIEMCCVIVMLSVIASFIIYRVLCQYNF